MRRVCYLLGLLGCGLWYLLSGSWLGWILLLTLVILPWLSLLLTLPALCSFSLTITGPERLRPGETGSFLLLGSCRWPMPPFRGKIRLRNLRTGQITNYDEVSGFASACGAGYRLTVKGARVSDYLGLFSLPVRRKGSMLLLVRPTEQPVEDPPELPRDCCVSWKPSGGRFSENHELRPYRPGDSLNTVHWKLSVKTGALTVREPQEPIRQTAGISLTLFGSDAVADAVLGQLLWLGNCLLDNGLELEIRAAADCGTVVRHAASGEALLRIIDDLLCMAAPESDVLPEPGQAQPQFSLGVTP